MLTPCMLGQAGRLDLSNLREKSLIVVGLGTKNDSTVSTTGAETSIRRCVYSCDGLDEADCGFSSHAKQEDVLYKGIVRSIKSTSSRRVKHVQPADRKRKGLLPGTVSGDN